MSVRPTCARSALCALLVALAAPAADAARPALGRHAVEFCVSIASAAPNCGPARAELSRNGSASVRIHDLIYQLQLHSSQVEVVLMQGFVQIDEFIAPYQWVGRSLQFTDDEHNAHYEVRFDDGAKHARQGR